jgi:septum formation protein
VTSSDVTLQVTFSDLVLASASPRRLDLLAQIGIIPNRVISTNIDETPKRDELPHELVLRLARTKAASVDAECVLAADTVVALGRRVLPKVEDPLMARLCLEKLSGRRHTVLTAIVLITGGKRTERVVSSVVAFSRLTPGQIEKYVAGGEWQGKAGGYAIQGSAASFVRFLSGSYSNVVGLPLFETAQLLRGIGRAIP